MDKKISQLGATTVPVDADLLAIVQSGITKKITYQNLRNGIINASNLTADYLPFWDGTNFQDSILYTDGTHVSIGTTTAIALFHGEQSSNNIVTNFASINPNVGTSAGQQIYLDNGVQSFVSGLLGVNSNNWSSYGNPKDVFFKYATADGTTGNVNFITPATGAGGEFNFFGFKSASTGVPTLGVKASNVSINKAVSASSANLHVKGDGITSATFAAKFDDSADQNILTLRDDKRATFYGDININAQTASTVPYLDASKNLISSAITPTELNYLSGATSSLQAQIAALTVGLSWKEAVRGATTTTLPSYTVSGGNKILTATANGAFPTTDGLTYTVNQSILVKDETAGNAPNNGIYTITQVGTAGTPWILTRRNDANTGPLLVSATVAISEGTTLQDTQYVCNTDSPISLGVTNITFVAVGGTTYVGTTNRVTVTGNQIDISATFESLLEKVANKDATGGYAGLTLFKINFKDTSNTYTSFFTNSNTAARTYTFKDADGTMAFTSDIANMFTHFMHAHTTYSPADATTYYFNSSLLTGAPATANTNRFFRFTRAFTLREVNLLTVQTGNGSNESATLYLYNVTTGADVGTIGTFTNDAGASTIASFNYTGLSLAVNSTDKYAWKIVTPTYATNPTGVISEVRSLFN